MNGTYIGMGVGLGVCLGAAFGAAIDNVGLGVGLGLCFGAALGTTFGMIGVTPARSKVAIDKPLPHPLGLLEGSEPRRPLPDTPTDPR